MRTDFANTPAIITGQLRVRCRRGVLLLVILTLALPAMPIAQDAPGAAQGQETAASTPGSWPAERFSRSLP